MHQGNSRSDSDRWQRWSSPVAAVTIAQVRSERSSCVLAWASLALWLGALSGCAEVLGLGDFRSGDSPGGSAGTGGDGGGSAGGGAAGGSGGQGVLPSPPSCAQELECAVDGDPAVSCCETIQVAGGAFFMGRGDSGADSYDSGDADEQPEHDATVATFYLDRFEVTVGRFRAFVEQYNGTPPADGSGAHPFIVGSGWQNGWNTELPGSPQDLIDALATCSNGAPTWTNMPGSDESFPINCLTWHEAFAFCVWDGGRLPTEAEWEYAAAGGVLNQLYPWGHVDPVSGSAHANFGDDGATPSIPVGSRPAGRSYWGHDDLGGSMWEWVLDRYDGEWYESFVGNPCDNCSNLTIGTGRGTRGGSWFTQAPMLRAAFRGSSVTNVRFGFYGLRCARNP